MPRSKPPVVIGRLPNGFPFYLTEGDGNCLFRSLAFHVYGSENDHVRVRNEITEEVITNWARYADFCTRDEDAAAYSVRMREQKDYGDYIEIIAAEHIYKRPCFVWDQATPDAPFEPSHRFYLADHDPDDPPPVSSNGPFPDDAMLLAHTEAGQHYSFVLLPDHAAALECLESESRTEATIHAFPMLPIAPNSSSSAMPVNPKNLRRKGARQRAFLRSTDAKTSPSDVEDMESIHETLDTERKQASEQLIHHSEAAGPSQQCHSKQKGQRNRMVAYRKTLKKSQKKRGKNKGKGKRSKTVTSANGTSGDEYSPSEGNESCSNGSEGDDSTASVQHKYSGKGYVSFGDAANLGEDEITEYELEPINLQDYDAVVCPHCACRKWKGETTNCCDKGKKLWKTYKAPPQNISILFQERKFYLHQRRYNALFAMSAFGASTSSNTERRTWTQPNGDSMLTLHGRAYHRLFDPFEQYVDENIAVTNLARLYLFDNGHVDHARQDGKLNLTFVNSIKTALLQHNKWVHTYLAVVDEVHRESGGVVPDARIVFAPTSREKDGPIVGDAPAADNGEIAAVIFKESQHARRTAWVYPRAQPRGADGSAHRPRFLSILDRAYETLQYPLLFFRGQAGWGKDITNQHASGGGEETKEKEPSIYFYARQQILNNPTFPLLPRVVQEWACDTMSRIEDMHLSYLQRPEMQKRLSTFNNILRPQNDSDAAVGKRLPLSHHGHPAKRKKAQTEGLAVVARRGKPHLFITVTCNENWKEITENLLANQRPKDRPDLCNRVFKLKLAQILKELRSGEVFGKLDYHMYVIEFQKRGLPHAHIIVKLVGPGPEATHQIDECIWAQLPDTDQYGGALREKVIKMMVHMPCEKLSKAPCLQEYLGVMKCKSKFPKEFSETTHIDAKTGFCAYRRPDNGSTTTVQGVAADNRHIAGYNPYLLLRFNCHINVDLVTADSVVKYLYKYIHKGEDFAKARVACEGDEIEAYRTSRYISASEAMWRLFGYDMEYRAPAVQTLYTHLENEQIVVFEEDTTDEERKAAAKNTHTQLMNYFARPQNVEFDPLTYLDYYEQYTVTKERTSAASGLLPEGTCFDGNRNIVKKRTRQNSSISRLSFLSPTIGDAYYLRILLMNRAARSFEEMRRVGGTVHATNEAAARALNLVQTGKEYELALEEASAFLMASELRRLFVTLLLDGANGAELWNIFQDDLSEDYQRNMHPDDAISEALRQIDLQLLENGRTGTHFGLPEVQHADTELERHRRMFVPAKENERAQAGSATLTEEQRLIYNQVIDSVRSNDGMTFMLRAPGGTGKTHTLNLVAAKLRGERKVVIEVASTGIAALQMSHGWTAHSMFKLPRDDRNVEGCYCDVAAETQRAQFLRAADLIVWDEITMSHRYSIEAVDNTLQDLMQNKAPFGGKTVVFAGDWRQTGPVVQGGTDDDSLAASFVSSPLYAHVQPLTLGAAMRDRDDPAYASFVRTVGNGTAAKVQAEDGKECISLRLPDGRRIKATSDPNKLLRFVYGNWDEYNPDECGRKGILAPTNVSTDLMNAEVLKHVNGETMVALSTDTLKTDEHGRRGSSIAQRLQAEYPPEVLHSINGKNVPPHKLELKENGLIMITRNVNFREKMVNGQKAVIERIRGNVIQARLLCEGSPTIVIPRITFDISVGRNGVTFQRRQYPVRLCYAMTINKSQGQTLNTVGVDLRSDVFAHGQLYVALSRARGASKIMVLVNADRITASKTALTANATIPQFIVAATVGTPEEATVAAASAATPEATAAKPIAASVQLPAVVQNDEAAGTAANTCSATILPINVSAEAATAREAPSPVPQRRQGTPATARTAEPKATSQKRKHQETETYSIRTQRTRQRGTGPKPTAHQAQMVRVFNLLSFLLLISLTNSLLPLLPQFYNAVNHPDNEHVLCTVDNVQLRVRTLQVTPSLPPVVCLPLPSQQTKRCVPAKRCTAAPLRAGVAERRDRKRLHSHPARKSHHHGKQSVYLQFVLRCKAARPRGVSIQQYRTMGTKCKPQPIERGRGPHTATIRLNLVINKGLGLMLASKYGCRDSLSATASALSPHPLFSTQEALFECNLIFIPHNVNNLNLHWQLAVIDVSSKAIRFYDSQGGGNRILSSILRKWLKDAAIARGLHDTAAVEWTVEDTPSDAPTQRNG